MAIPNMTDPRAHLDDDRLRKLCDKLGRDVQLLQAELAHKDRELATLVRQYELRRASDVAWWAKQGEAADQRRERWEWWTNLAFLALGFGFGLVSAWRMG